ncbi:MAG: hypothetical protein M9939_26490 [Mesorhizobium sp.]|nr:hypothetical protein [Mesorhizobium sp.]MCO5085104.1 hypothetical protein [Rhizobiaceae bacterium]MCO5164642.1 hypothetical protein [Mesorhizobium sp.]
MVAYSFKKQFAEPILSGRKRQTIRADRRRHARPGERLQLYTGMRTKHCRLVARTTCIAVLRIVIDMPAGRQPSIMLDGRPVEVGLDHFARLDGFEDWSDMATFWMDNHPGVDRFEGVLIQWGALNV